MHDPNVQVSRKLDCTCIAERIFFMVKSDHVFFTTPTQSQKNSTDEAGLALSRNLVALKKLSSTALSRQS